MKWVVRVDRAVKEYDGASALNGLGFEAGRREILGFLDLNGAEKTTLMSIITRTIPPTEGGWRSRTMAPQDGA